MSHLDALEQELRELKLTRLADQLQGFLADAAKQEWDYGTFLGNVVKGELAARRDRRTEMATRMARLPFVKTLESFDFAYQPSINAKQINELSAVRWIANGDNLILLGPPGVGKTHLAVALGIKAIEQGYKIQFISGGYKKGEMILTSNQPFSGWGEVFGDAIIATAILDRVLHHSITINIKGESYRLKEKLKAGIVQRKEPKD